MLELYLKFINFRINNLPCSWSSSIDVIILYI